MVNTDSIRDRNIMSENRKKNIMVVDDEESVRTVVKRLLEKEGYTVAAFADGVSALTSMADFKPHLVILDIKMPGLDGFQVLDIIRQRSDVPVIMLSALGEVTNVRDALAIGADDFLRKPFSTRELAARVKAKLRRD
jgi:OmpR family response regulator RpaB